MKKVVFSCGDIAGIGPEIIVKTIANEKLSLKYQVIITGPAVIFIPLIKQYCSSAKIYISESYDPSFKLHDTIIINDIASGSVKAGVSNGETGRVALQSIYAAHDIVCTDISNSVLVTAPISKEAINAAGSDFPGHTEMLAFLSGVQNFSMMFLSSKMLGALLTIHEPLSIVADMITPELLESKFVLLNDELHNKFGKKNPRIALLALNPHAGESGTIGKEEQEILIPFIQKYPYVEGPFPADGFFGSESYKNYDLVISPYHDQLLIPFKLLAFSEGVNYTAGLPYIRTSPDHGTAFSIAGRGIADPSSMISAVRWALNLLENK